MADNKAGNDFHAKLYSLPLSLVDSDANSRATETMTEFIQFSNSGDFIIIRDKDACNPALGADSPVSSGRAESTHSDSDAAHDRQSAAARSTRPYDSLRRQLCAYGFVAVEFTSFPDSEVPADWETLSRRMARIWCHPHFYRGASDWSKVPRKKAQRTRRRRTKHAQLVLSDATDASVPSLSSLSSLSSAPPAPPAAARRKTGAKANKAAVLEVDSIDDGKTKIKHSTATKWIEM
ncbi:hypothetical protein GQ42DRAFT_179851, partial [Ramicandelaber brevisporus]